MERKLATVLFADLVSSTELVAGQDPEITRRRVTTFFDGVQRSSDARRRGRRARRTRAPGTTRAGRRRGSRRPRPARRPRPRGSAGRRPGCRVRASSQAVPTVGWPAKGSSRPGVKIRIRPALAVLDEDGLAEAELGGHAPAADASGTAPPSRKTPRGLPHSPSSLTKTRRTWSSGTGRSYAVKRQTRGARDSNTSTATSQSPAQGAKIAASVEPVDEGSTSVRRRVEAERRREADGLRRASRSASPVAAWSGCGGDSSTEETSRVEQRSKRASKKRRSGVEKGVNEAKKGLQGMKRSPRRALKK